MRLCALPSTPFPDHAIVAKALGKAADPPIGRCPFCGAHGGRHVNVQDIRGNDGLLLYFVVVCAECGARGPCPSGGQFQSRKLAILRWNELALLDQMLILERKTQRKKYSCIAAHMHIVGHHDQDQQKDEGRRG